MENLVLKYYCDHASFLKPEKFQHWYSRLALWTGKEEYWDFVRANEDSYLGTFEEDLEGKLKKALLIPAFSPKLRYLTPRKAFLEKYPKLRAYNRVLFLTLFARTLYGRDIRGAVLRNVSLEELIDIYESLYFDQHAILMLSTHAINFLSLSHHLFEKIRLFPLSPEYFLTLVRFTSPVDAHVRGLKIYLLTHVIIGASRFYSEAIQEDRAVYELILREIEWEIEGHFSELSLDQKLEFLVCARLLGKYSRLENPIYQETEASKALNGNFIIDRFNTAVNPKKQGLHCSEHRNILFVLSKLPWVKAHSVVSPVLGDRELSAVDAR